MAKLNFKKYNQIQLRWTVYRNRKRLISENNKKFSKRKQRIEVLLNFVENCIKFNIDNYRKSYKLLIVKWNVIVPPLLCLANCKSISVDWVTGDNVSVSQVRQMAVPVHRCVASTMNREAWLIEGPPPISFFPHLQHPLLDTIHPHQLYALSINTLLVSIMWACFCQHGRGNIPKLWPFCYTHMKLVQWITFLPC